MRRTSDARKNSGVESPNEDVYSKLDQLLMFKPNNNNPYDCSKKAKISLRKSLLFKTEVRKDMLCSTPTVKGHLQDPFPSDISSINFSDNETDYQNGQFEAVVHEPHHTLSSPSQIRQDRKNLDSQSQLKKSYQPNVSEEEQCSYVTRSIKKILKNNMEKSSCSIKRKATSREKCLNCRKSLEQAITEGSSCTTIPKTLQKLNIITTSNAKLDKTGLSKYFFKELCNNALSNKICDKTNLEIDNVNDSVLLSMEDREINEHLNSSVLNRLQQLQSDIPLSKNNNFKDTPKLLGGKTKGGGRLMSVVNKLLSSAVSKNDPTTKSKQNVQPTINFNSSSTSPVSDIDFEDFTLYKTLFSHNEIKKRESPWESELQDLLLLDKMENTRNFTGNIPDVTSLGKNMYVINEPNKDNRSHIASLVKEIRPVKNTETVPTENSQTENEVVAKIVNFKDFIQTRTQTKKYSCKKLSEGKHVSSSPKHSAEPDFYKENSSNNVIVSREPQRKLPATESTIITRNRKIQSKRSRSEDEVIIQDIPEQEESLEKSLQTIKENNQRRIQPVEKLNPSVNTKTEVSLENDSKQMGQRMKPLKQPKRDDTTKSEELIKAKTQKNKNDNKKPMIEKGTRKSLRKRKIATSGLLYNCYILETRQSNLVKTKGEKSKPNKLKTNSNIKSVSLEKVLDTNKSKNNAIKNHADNYINQKPNLENVIDESNDVVCIPSTSECKENSTATRRGRRKKEIHTLSNETNILGIRGLTNYDTNSTFTINKNCEPDVKNTIEESNDVACTSNTSECKESAPARRRGRKRNEIHTQNTETNNPNGTFNISCATRKSLRIKRRPNKSLLYHCYAVGEKRGKQ
ncbi:uncharacterized protein LOC109607521 isoform X2 [Aethina tumida]|uniref:uncharacterized protein LOC109607521 isoform X2 n=1 Tax=Aethina tumida TaxID=116153 RepID=UPI0021479F8A|nr:uncharacterized protein LOC109607521 isoform X2 [Aethina tumida]